MISTKTMTLEAFLAEYAACRVWHVSVASPAGSELAVNTDEDAADEDYCDGETLVGTIPEVALELAGTVSRDADGEYRWEVESFQGSGVRDYVGSTVLNLKVWGEAA